MDLSDLPGVGAIGGVAGIIGDILINGGDVIVSFLVFLLLEPETWLSLVMYLERLAGMVAWLPEAIFEQILIVAIVLVIIVSAVRVYRSWRESQ